MKMYSDFPASRGRQITVDILSIALISAWVWVGSVVYRLVENLAEYGRQMEAAGAGFRQTMTDVGTNLGNVPLIGAGIRAPFDEASGAGAALESAGQSQQLAVNQLATGLGIGIAALPILTILLVWLIPRTRFIRAATRARRGLKVGVGLDLLALRALATQRLDAVQAVSPDPVGAWRTGNQQVIRALAGLELARLGLRLPPLPTPVPDGQP